MIVDTHCHLSDEKIEKDLKGVIERARKVGVEKIIAIATDLKDARRVFEMADENEAVFAAGGIYPGKVAEIESIEMAMEELESLVRENRKVVAIGEIGMDGYWERRSLDKQAELFRAQLELAVKLGLPVVVHSRGAGGEIKEVMESMMEIPSGQFHCFGEDREFLEYILEKGFYVSFCGNVTYKKAYHLRDLLNKVPLERLLLETDSPYLAPEGKRGEVNEPANVIISLRFIADYLGMSWQELADKTSQNAKCLFSGI